MLVSKIKAARICNLKSAKVTKMEETKIGTPSWGLLLGMENGVGLSAARA